MATEAVAGRVVVDRYLLIETLGTGPMGPVWRARDRRLDREVAVREVELPDILDDLEQAALAEKVLREASSASHLDHPGVVSVLDVVAEDGRPFVVSELVTAPTMADVVATKGPFEPGEVAAMGLTLLDALAAAHDLGLVHRDVRPSNVLLTDSGVRLADFGVASMVDDPRVTGNAMHEPSYLAPEQTESAGASALSDVWSLGATLYFAVEGTPPFGEGPAATTIAAIVGEAPRPARRAGPLQPVFDALLVKDAMDRPDDSATRGLLTASAAGNGEPAVPEPAVVEPAVVPPAVAPAPPPPFGLALLPDPVEVDDEPVADQHTQTPAATVTGGHPADSLAESLDDPPPASANGAHPAPPPPASEAQDGGEAQGGGDDMWSPLPPPAEADAGRETREPWFFSEVPVETVPPPPLPEPPPRAEPVPERPRGRFPRGLWAALLAALVAAVMIALIITGGHTLHAQRPTVEKDVGAVATWTPYTDTTTGFTIRYPSSWSVRHNGTQTFFVDPAGVSYLEVDHQQPPAQSLTGSAFEQEKSFSASHPTYNRMGIDATTYQDKPASLWEFTYNEGGVDIHAVDLGVNSSKYGFAVFFQARSDNWSKAQGTWDDFKSVFGLPQ